MDPDMGPTGHQVTALRCLQDGALDRAPIGHVASLLPNAGSVAALSARGAKVPRREPAAKPAPATSLQHANGPSHGMVPVTRSPPQA